MRIAVTKDLLSGLLFIAFGIGTIVVAANYGIGTAMRIGSGLFPILIGGIIALLGLFMFIQALRNAQASETIASWEVGASFFVLLAVVAFALLIGRWGLVPAIVAVVLISHPACRESSLIELAAIATLLCLVTAGIFVYGLNLPIRLWGSW
jgi:hypothetical protein